MSFGFGVDMSSVSFCWVVHIVSRFSWCCWSLILTIFAADGVAVAVAQSLACLLTYLLGSWCKKVGFFSLVEMVIWWPPLSRCSKDVVTVIAHASRHIQLIANCQAKTIKKKKEQQKEKKSTRTHTTNSVFLMNGYLLKVIFRMCSYPPLMIISHRVGNLINMWTKLSNIN